MNRIFFLVFLALVGGCSSTSAPPQEEVQVRPTPPLIRLALEYPFDEGAPPAPGWGRCPIRCYKFDDPNLGIAIPVDCPEVKENNEWCVPVDVAPLLMEAGADIRVHRGVYYMMVWPFVNLRKK